MKSVLLDLIKLGPGTGRDRCGFLRLGIKPQAGSMVTF